MSVLAFPKPPYRAWYVHPSAIEAGEFQGSYIGPADFEGPTQTGRGALRLVVECLLRPTNRHGLPIVAPPEATELAMNGPTPLRQPPQRQMTDLEKFQRAARFQSGRAGRPTFDGDDFPPGGRAA